MKALDVELTCEWCGGVDYDYYILVFGVDVYLLCVGVCVINCTCK